MEWLKWIRILKILNIKILSIKNSLKRDVPNLTFKNINKVSKNEKFNHIQKKVRNSVC